MRTYEEDRKAVVEFLNNNNMFAYDLYKICKDLCKCGTCKHFMPLYTKEGKETEFGSCLKNKIPKATKALDISCGFWKGEK